MITTESRGAVVDLLQYRLVKAKSSRDVHDLVQVYFASTEKSPYKNAYRWAFIDIIGLRVIQAERLQIDEKKRKEIPIPKGFEKKLVAVRKGIIEDIEKSGKELAGYTVAFENATFLIDTFISKYGEEHPDHIYKGEYPILFLAKFIGYDKKISDLFSYVSEIAQ